MIISHIIEWLGRYISLETKKKLIYRFVCRNQHLWHNGICVTCGVKMGYKL